MSKYIRVKCKIVNDERRCTLSIQNDLDSIEHLKKAILAKFSIEEIVEEKNNDGDEEEEEEEEEAAGQGDNDDARNNNRNNNNNNNDYAAIRIALKDVELSYTIQGDSSPLKIKTNDEFLELMNAYLDADIDVKIQHIIAAKAGGKLFCNDNYSDKQKQAIKTQVMKISMMNIPYKFSGKKNENINHFIYKLLGFCKNNNITSNIIIDLILNGTLIKDDAFNFIELEKEAIGKLYALNDDDRLAGILELLKIRYRCENLIMKIRSKIKELVQDPTELIKDYLVKCDKLYDAFDLELKIAASLGDKYKGIDEYEKTDYVMNGMRVAIRSKVLDKAVDIYGSARINYRQLKEILSKFEKKELYLKSLSGTKKYKNVNCINDDSPYSPYSSQSVQCSQYYPQYPQLQTQYQQYSSTQFPSPSKKELKQQNELLRNEINFIKLGNQKLHNRVPGGNNNDNPNNNNNGGNLKRNYYSFEQKKRNGDCKFGRKCKFGLDCKFLHQKEDRSYFYNNKIRGNSRGAYGRGRGAYGRGRGGYANRGRGGRNNTSIVEINAISGQVNDMNDEKSNYAPERNINIASLDITSDF